MQPDPSTPLPDNMVNRTLFDAILRTATLPVLLILIVFAIILVNYLMSPGYRQAKRAREIRKAVAQREALKAAAPPAQPDSPEHAGPTETLPHA